MTFVDVSSYAGLFAMYLLTANIWMGTLIAVRYNPLRQWPHRRINLFQWHNRTAYVAFCLILLHPTLLLLSQTAGFHWYDILYPVNSPGQRLYNSFGAITFYLVLLIVVTSYFRVELGRKRWKPIHFLTYAAACSLFAHGILIDPEIKDRPTDFLDGEKIQGELCCLLVIAATVWRIREGRRRKQCRRLRSGEYVFVVALVFGNDQVSGEALDSRGAGCLGHAGVETVIAEQFGDAPGLGRDIAYRFEKAIDAVRDQFRHAAHARGDRRHAAGHGFERGQPEGLHFAGQQQHVVLGDQALDVVLLAEERDAGFNA